MNLLREYIRELLKEGADAVGFVHDLAAASDQFGEKGMPFFGGNPGKGGGRAIKRAFSKHADYQFLNSINTVHWTDPNRIGSLFGKGKDELSTVMTLPEDPLKPLAISSNDVGLWVKGRITLAANDMDRIYTEFYHSYGPGKEGTEEEVAHRDRSSGRNKRPTVAKDYSRYGNLKRGTEFGEKKARDIPYVLDQSMWSPHKHRSNEALVDNWKPIGFVVQAEVADVVAKNADVEDAWYLGKLEKVFKAADKLGIPIYSVDKKILRRPK